jgi:hypothetical protein
VVQCKQQADYFLKGKLAYNRWVDLVISRDNEQRPPRPALESLPSSELAAMCFAVGGTRATIVEDVMQVGGQNVTRGMAIALLDKRFRPVVGPAAVDADNEEEA